MDFEEQRFRDAERLLNQSGYTLTEFLIASSRYKSTLLMMSDDDLVSYRALYDCIAEGGLSKGEKGKKLEELSAILFQKSADSLFDVYKNCRTSTNEIDLLIRWTEKARLSGLQAAFPFFGDSFLCECKNYDGAVKVTYVGKFSSLMLVTDSYFGIMISWEGVTGRGKWSDSQGLIKNIANGIKDSSYMTTISKYCLKCMPDDFA